MPNGSFADRVLRWQRLVQTLTANSPELPGVADDLAQLQNVLQRTADMKMQEDVNQGLFRTTVTNRLALDKEGEDLRIRIMLSLKGKYGIHADKLYSFGMRPRKARRSKSAAPVDPPPFNPPPVIPPVIQPSQPTGSLAQVPAADPLTK